MHFNLNHNVLTTRIILPPKHFKLARVSKLSKNCIFSKNYKDYGFDFNFQMDINIESSQNIMMELHYVTSPVPFV